MSKKGIIITPPFKYDGRTLNIISSEIDPEALRLYLLYWDNIEWPDNNVISLGGDTAETAFLRVENILTRTRIVLSGFSGNLGDSILMMQEAAFDYHNKSEPGLWSLAQEGEVLLLPKDSILDKPKIEVELYKAIPIPDKDVALDDILGFKERRKDELLAFRTLMDELYLGIIDSSDIPRAKSAAINRLQVSIGDLHKVMKESSIKRRLSSIKIELNLLKLFTSAMSIPVVKTVFNTTPEVAALIGVATSAIIFSINTGPMSKRIPEKLKDYAYLYHIEQEMF